MPTVNDEDLSNVAENSVSLRMEMPKYPKAENNALASMLFMSVLMFNFPPA